MTRTTRGDRFRYLDHALDPATRTLTCRYDLDGTVFTESFRFPGDPDQDADWSSPAVAEAARIVFLVAGVSYYKATAPPVIDLGDLAITDTERIFLHEFYVDGLGEFAFRNEPRLDLTDLVIEAPRLERGAAPVVAAPTRTRPLIPFGGGVDSIVSVELLRSIADEPSLFVVNRPDDRFEAIERPARQIGWPVVRAERLIDEKILRSKDLGWFNGHVPVTGIISAVAVMAAALGGHDAVVMSNEWSASAGTVELDGRSINHQYSKSEGFEARFREVLAGAVGPYPDYFSLLRPYTELWIAQQFSRYERYLPTFMSCNRAFHINPAHRLDHWCGICPKCCFIDLVLAPFVDADGLRKVWERGDHPAVLEPLRNPAESIFGQFDKLLALSTDEKPWECVGDVHESRVSVRLAASRSDRVDSVMLQRLAVEVDESAHDVDALLRPVGRHFIPERYAPADLLV